MVGGFPADAASRAILGNIGTLIALRVGMRDARVFWRTNSFSEFYVEDLVSLARGTST
jgi:hypothetical protein